MGGQKWKKSMRDGACLYTLSWHHKIKRVTDDGRYYKIVPLKEKAKWKLELDRHGDEGNPMTPAPTETTTIGELLVRDD
jgi:hypothetical protein